MTLIRETKLLAAAEESGLVDASLLESLKKKARRQQLDLLTMVCFAQRLPLKALYRNYAELNAFDFCASEPKPDIKALRKLTLERALQHHLLPVESQQRSFVMVAANPEDRQARQLVRRLFHQEPVWTLAEPDLIERTLAKYAPIVTPYETESPALPTFDPVQTVDDVLNQAFLNRASDVHFEPEKDGLSVRYRMDGRLREDGRLFASLQGNALINRIKVLADLDIAENRIPQDGAMTHYIPTGGQIDIRVATLPTQFGERATLRLLGGNAQLLELNQIGMEKRHLLWFTNAIKKPHGMILITGPTGSGKSTTLYAALNELRNPETNILTAEDPVEMTLPGISQLQVNSKTGFSDALRSFLRHDPDVIMVGEIRDRETAEIAMKASLTGHLVFSTLHTNSALESIPRLIDIGIEPYLVSSTLACVIAQRLVRRLCPKCKREQSLNAVQREWLKCERDVRVFTATGCAFCQDIGYSGRLPLFEMLVVDSHMQENITHRQSPAQILEQAENYSSLADDGKNKFLQGLTSWDELQRLGLVPFVEGDAG